MLGLGDAAVLDVAVRRGMQIFLEKRRHVAAVEVHVIGEVLHGEGVFDVRADEIRHVGNIRIVVHRRQQFALGFGNDGEKLQQES